MRALIGIGLALSLTACGKPAGEAPDAVFFNAIVHTGNDSQPTAEAVSVKNSRIVAVGTSADLVKTASQATHLYDLTGVHLYPGFTDAHVHLRGVGEREMTLNLDKIASVAELVSVVGEAIKTLKPGETLIGRGWIETHWPEKRFPTRQDLDAVSGDHPVALTRADGHALVANSAALKAAGIAIDAKVTAQPQGGRIEVDANGLPTGMLIDGAMGPVAVLGANPTDAWVDAAYEKGAQVYAARGWTGVHNMSVAASDIPRINRLSKTGKLPLRIYNAVDGGSVKFAADGKLDMELFKPNRETLVTTRAIKLYMDGALGSRGALLSAPYADQKTTSGLARSETEPTRKLLKAAYEAGVQVCFHAIGDKGNKTVLDWMEQTFASVAPAEQAKRDPRWRIEHAQVLDTADIPRFAKLGVIPSMQPSHAIGDLYFAPARLGPQRLIGAYAWRALIDAGTVIAGGSDAPVEVGSPLIEFYAAVARKDLKGQSAADWHPEQAVTRAEALKMFTLWPAIASFQSEDLGVIAPGKLADLTGFSGDLLTVPEADILTLQTKVTVVGGAVTYLAPK